MTNFPTAEALNEQGIAWLRQGRPDEALLCWQEALEIQELPGVHNNIGFLHAGQGDFDRAIACYQRALALEPRYPEALNNLGIAQFQVGRTDEAVRCFQAALSWRRDYAEALNNLGSVFLSQGDPQAAADSYRRALTLQPGNAETHSNLGVACKELGLADEAVACWRRSLELAPGDPRTHRNLGTFLNQRGQRAEARRCFEQVRALLPDDAEACFLVAALADEAAPAQMPSAYVANLFDSYAASFDKDLVERLAYRGPELLRSALGPAPPVRSLDVLDLGCGTGLCGVEFRSWAKRLVGVDLSANMLEQARKRGVYDELVQDDLMTALDRAEGHFDLVLAGDVLVYSGDLAPLFESVSGALRQGGRFAFTVETVEGADYRLLPELRFAHCPAYVEKIAAQAHFKQTRLEPIVLRMEDGQPLAGLTVVLEK